MLRMLLSRYRLARVWEVSTSVVGQRGRLGRLREPTTCYEGSVIVRASYDLLNEVRYHRECC
jgi:hypothetical protein